MTTPGDAFDGAERSIRANWAQVEANNDVIGANLKLVKSARWRLIRNRRLLDRNWELVRANTVLLSENNLLIARRWASLNAR